MPGSETGKQVASNRKHLRALRANNWTSYARYRTILNRLFDNGSTVIAIEHNRYDQTNGLNHYLGPGGEKKEEKSCLLVHHMIPQQRATP